MSNFRESSKRHWASKDTVEHINAGSLQRIADATEKMAQSWSSLVEERDRYKRWYEDERARANRKDNIIRGLRGALNRMKKARQA